MNSTQFTELPLLIRQSKGENARTSAADCDCDCWSPTAWSTKQQPVKVIPDATYSLANSFWTIPLTTRYFAALVEKATTPVVFNKPTLIIANHFRQPNLLDNIPPVWRKAWGSVLIRSVLEQMVMHGLLVSDNDLAPAPTENPTVLSAWLHITDRCNLRCTYCYLPHDWVDMSSETGYAIIDAIFRSAVTHDYREVKLKYAGGEAMLRFPFIVELHRYARKLANQHTVALDGVILSNGTYITPKIVDTMQSLGLRLMISLDGLGNHHDSQRSYANGRGTFSDVARAIEFALDYGLIPDISITVSGRNAGGLSELIEWVLARDLPFSLNFYRENDFSAAYEDLKLEDEKIIAGMLTAFKVIEANLPRRNLLASLVDRANLSTPHLRTCGVGQNYLVFDHLGQVSKCQMQMDKPVTTVKADDLLSLVRADQLGIQNMSVEEKEGCRDCEWKYWCTGGCPLTTYQTTGQYDVKSPNCNIYKALYPEAVRLEGLRLLKYADGASSIKLTNRFLSL